MTDLMLPAPLVSNRSDTSDKNSDNYHAVERSQHQLQHQQRIDVSIDADEHEDNNDILSDLPTPASESIGEICDEDDDINSNNNSNNDDVLSVSTCTILSSPATTNNSQSPVPLRSDSTHNNSAATGSNTSNNAVSFSLRTPSNSTGNSNSRHVTPSNSSNRSSSAMQHQQQQQQQRMMLDYTSGSGGTSSTTSSSQYHHFAITPTNSGSSTIRRGRSGSIGSSRLVSHTNANAGMMSSSNITPSNSSSTYGHHSVSVWGTPKHGHYINTNHEFGRMNQIAPDDATPKVCVCVCLL
jgi:hypothetical protein